MAIIVIMLLQFYLTGFICHDLVEQLCGNITWNNNVKNYLDLHVQFCKRYCDENGKLHIDERNNCVVPRCFPCDCESDCSIYDTCCPKLINSVYTEPEDMSYHGLPDASRFVCDKLFNGLTTTRKEILFISDCDLHFLNSSLQDSDTVLEYSSRCQDSSTETMDDITPYSDMYYGIVFKNKFCALCNGYTINSNLKSDVINSSVKVASPWSIEVSCEHFQQLYHLTSELELLKAASNLHFVCDISSFPPKSHYDFSPKSCIVESCVDGCLIDEPPSDDIPTIFLFDTPEHFHAVEYKCVKKNSWLDFQFQGECHTATCSLGKISTQEGYCSTALSVIRGLCYKLALMLTPINVSVNQMKFLHEAIYTKLSAYSYNDNVDLTTSCVLKISKNRASTLHSCRITAYIASDKGSPRDELENKFIGLALYPWTIKLDSNTNISVTLKPTLLGTEIVDIIDSSSNDNLTRKFSLEKRHENEQLFYFKVDFIDITYSFICPFVTINISEIFSDADSVRVFFLFGGRKFDIMAGPNISIVQGKLRICLDTFKRLLREDVTTSLPFVILYYFQVVCFLLSIVCLVLSLVTYFLFRDLRSLPGLNNMGLCVSMATAHICLLVTVECGVKGVLPYELCMFLAILLHYSWLASFAWMSVCGIHMYVVFTSRNALSHCGSYDRKKFTKNCFYAFGAPAVIVILGVVLNLGATFGASFGYNAIVCFIDTRESILTLVLSLLVPLGAMLISNGLLFTLTLREMVHASRIQKATIKVHRQGVMTYIKLSTVTGIFCIISAAGVWLDSIVIQFLTCPFMALQGVFIFFSFTFNRRVYKLYFDMLGLQRLGFTLTTQGGSSTMSSRQNKNRKDNIPAKTSSTSM